MMSKQKHTAIFSAIIAVILVFVLVLNVLSMTVFDYALKTFLGTMEGKSASSGNYDAQYYKPDYTKDNIDAASQALNEEICDEGLVVLMNEGGFMPYDEGTTFSLFSHSSVDWIVSGSGSGAGSAELDLKTAFTKEGFKINETLWDFYSSGNGKGYSRGPGVISFGEDEDWSINECPLSVLKKDSSALSSAKGSVPVFVLARTSGEGRDLARSMVRYTDVEEDKAKSYLEPDSIELEIISYLNDNYDDVVLIVNSANPVELGWVKDYPNIHSIIWAPGTGSTGLYSLPRLMKKGGVNPSGHLVDTFAYDLLASPAAQNFGDFAYTRADGSDATIGGKTVNYVTYAEGIYTGYKYYETRYEDFVMGTGNAGEFDYANEVQFPFGFGLSYTTFEWSDYKTEWNDAICTATVTVTNTGSIAGKEVVQLYAQAPYTQYDIDNRVEKASVILVGFAKTSLLEPGASETVTITFNEEQLKSYDYVNAKTYILDAGTYYITAADNAHSAVNNILAAKGYTTENSPMTADGSTALVNEYVPSNSDVHTAKYSTDSRTNAAVTNLFDFASQSTTVYLTRNNWVDTFPVPDGTVSSELSTNGNQVNSEDGKNYVWKKTISDADFETVSKTGAEASLNPNIQSMTPVYSQDNGMQLIGMRGLAFDDPAWDDLLNQLSYSDFSKTIPTSGYGSPAMPSIEKPITKDLDGPTKLNSTSPNSFAVEIVIAQTFNTDLVSRMGNIVGNGGLLYRINGWYAPALNLHRCAFGGRNFEYYSEDPFLTGTFAAAVIQGAAEKGVYSFLKHFALNSQEDHRGDRGENGVITWSNEQAIRENYLACFERAVKAPTVTAYYNALEGREFVLTEYQVPACTAIMTSFNRVGYTWAGGNYPLLTSLLQDEWGFHGFIVTDFQGGSYMDPIQMIYAGGGGILNSVNKLNTTLGRENASDYYYSRNAMHNILYTIANSNAMNGRVSGAVAKEGMAYYQLILIAVDVLAAVGIALLVMFDIVKYNKKYDELNG